jgi:hypothetical protein
MKHCLLYRKKKDWLRVGEISINLKNRKKRKKLEINKDLMRECGQFKLMKKQGDFKLN